LAGYLTFVNFFPKGVFLKNLEASTIHVRAINRHKFEKRGGGKPDILIDMVGR